MRTVRFAIDCRYIRERPSGIGAYVQALIDRMPQRAPNDELVLWAHPAAPQPLHEAANVTETVVRARANNLPWLFFPRRLAPFEGIDLLHAPSNVLPRNIPCRSVVTVHDLMWLDTPQLCEQSGFKRMFKTPFYQAGLRNALEHANRIIAISQATADAIARVAPQALPRVRVIRHGIESRFRPPANAAATRARCEQLGATGPYLLVVGQNAPYKNQRAIVEAFAAADRPRELGLVFVQRLNAGSDIRRAVDEHDIDDCVTWLSSVTDDDVIALMQSALALVQFSRAEGFGMPALEAMACGTVVIASDIPPLKEVLGPAGVTVPLSVRALAEAIGRVSRDAAWREDLQALGLERAKTFDWNLNADAHLEVYREALNA